MRKLVIYGNCQGLAIHQALLAQPALKDELTIVRHDLWLEGAALTATFEDYESADILLLQEISNWNHHPMRDRVPATTKVVRYPFLLMSALWPFNYLVLGEFDPAFKFAPPEKPFLLMEAGLAMLREQYPDADARVEAFRRMAFLRRPIDIARLAAMEEARLLKADRDTGSRLGRFVVEHYRTERLYHAFSHPSGRLLRELVAEVLERAEIDVGEINPNEIDSQKDYQIPIHPAAVEALGLTWITPEGTYDMFGEKLTFDDYCRRYIAAYG